MPLSSGLVVRKSFKSFLSKCFIIKNCKRFSSSIAELKNYLLCRWDWYERFLFVNSWSSPLVLDIFLIFYSFLLPSSTEIMHVKFSYQIIGLLLLTKESLKIILKKSLNSTQTDRIENSRQQWFRNEVLAYRKKCLCNRVRLFYKS